MTGAILAGGRSRRMGRDKALLEIGGRRIIDRTVSLLREIFPHLLIVTNTPSHYAYLGVRLVTDLLPGRGALGGLHTALFLASTAHVFVVACDMPFLNRQVIRYLLERSAGWDVVVPQVDRKLEPLHAVYSRRCLSFVEKALEKGSRKIIDFYPQVRVRCVPEEGLRLIDPELLSFRNVNTPEDLAVLRETSRSSI